MKHNATVLFITFSDQENWGLNKNRNQLHLNCTTDVDENWRLCFSRYFKKLICYDIYKRANSEGIIAANRELIKFAENYNPEYIIYPSLFNGAVTLETLIKLKHFGCKIVSFFFDDDIYYEKLSKHIIPYVDYCITVTNPNFVEKYISDGGNAFFSTPIPMASDIFCRFDTTTCKYDVSFVGNRHVADRQLWIEGLTQAGVNLTIPGGTGNSRKVHYSKFVEIINQSKINLHFSKHVVDGQLVPQLKGRIFEVTLAGGFLLCEYAPVIEQFFVLDKEIVCFKTVEEAGDKIKYYLEHDEEREAIAQNGYIRANKDYEGLKVIEKLFSEIENCDNNKNTLPVSSTVTPLQTELSNVYTLWTKALLRSSYPLRSQWKECAELALRTNQRNKQIKRLLLLSKWVGDPQPIRGLCKRIYWMIGIWAKKQYILMRKKLRFIKTIRQN